MLTVSRFIALLDRRNLQHETLVKQISLTSPLTKKDGRTMQPADVVKFLPLPEPRKRTQ